MVIILNSQSCFIDLYAYLRLISHSLDYYIFEVLKSGSINSQNVFFLKTILAFLGSLHFYINFRIGFSISAGILKSFMLNQLREKCLLFLKPGLPSV